MEKIKPFYVLDVPVYPYTMDGAVNFLNSQVKNKKQTFVVTANAEIIMMCQKDAEYKKIVCQNADLVLADDKAGIAEAARDKLLLVAPGLKVAGCRNGYFTEAENEEIIAEINASGADMLFAALGAPKQENWLARFRSELKPQVLMGVGGSFDVLAGKMDRAPLWMQKASLEWLFRLYKQPSRIGRMMVLPQFVIKVLQSK